MKKFLKLFIFIVSLLPTIIHSQNVVVIIIDGARYTETFGDSSHSYIPVMDSLSQYGTYIDEFYNDSITSTRRAVPALWTGAWTAVQDTFYNGAWTQYTLVPSIFEYYRQQTAAPANQCFYILKYVPSLWLPSFHSNYGPNYWPTFHSTGSLDSEVLTEALTIMTTYHPQHTWVYFANVDTRGHSGIWADYTRAIQIADSIVGETWKFIQNDPIYQNDTYLFVTNDHGRHDDAHGGFRSHGCGCEGCRHIMFLALGPTVKQNYISSITRNIPDLSVTIADILNVNPEYATGNNMVELFNPNQIEDQGEFQPHQIDKIKNYPNPFNPKTKIKYDLPYASKVKIDVISLLGQKIQTLLNKQMPAGSYEIEFNAKNLPSGVYYYRIQAEDPSTGSGQQYQEVRKMILMK